MRDNTDDDDGNDDGFDNANVSVDVFRRWKSIERYWNVNAHGASMSTYTSKKEAFDK